MIFTDRVAAGRQLAQRLHRHPLVIAAQNPLVVSLPRGGVVVGNEISRALGIEHTLLFVKKIGHPHNPEYALCAVAEQEKPYGDEHELKPYRTTAWFKNAVQCAHKENTRRRMYYLRGATSNSDFARTTLVLVDDGIATGRTVHAAVAFLASHKPHKIIVATPVISSAVAQELKALVDDVVQIILVPPEQNMSSVSAYYREFSQVPDTEVMRLMRINHTYA